MTVSAPLQPPSRPPALPPEAAAFLRTTTQTLANMRYRGTGPRFVKSGRRILYRWEDLDAYVQENLHSSTGAA